MSNAFLELKTLLIVQDASGVADPLLERLLEHTYDLITSPAHRSDILRTVQSQKPHLLILPFVEDPVEWLATIQEVATLRTTAVVVLLKEWDFALAKQAMDAGASGYLLQPFNDLHTSAMLESSWHHFQKVVTLQENLDQHKSRPQPPPLN